MSGMAHMHLHSYPVYEGFRHIMDPYWYGESFEAESLDEFGLRAARALEDEILAVGPENVAAFAGEPVQGAGGVKIPPETYWPEVQRIVHKYGILLLADEVITGFGRLGDLVRLANITAFAPTSSPSPRLRRLATSRSPASSLTT